MVYEWKVPLHKVSAQEAGDHIEKLDRIHGEVTPQILLDDSRPENALLHPCYEWDDEKAAEKYRLHQSKMIIGNLVCVSVSDADQTLPEPVRAFISVNDRNEKAKYRPTVIALSDAEMKKKAFENAERELEMFKKKYKDLIDVEKILRDFIWKIAN